MTHHKKKKHLHHSAMNPAGSPDALVSLLITADKDEKNAVDRLIKKGSRHKRVLNTILLKRLYKLVETVEKSSDTT